MLSDCTAAGDSIALGVGQAMGCKIQAKVGASSALIATYSVDGNLCILSDGSNDPTNPRLRANVERFRRKVTCSRVVWILPVHKRARAIVRAVAAKWGDPVVSFVPGRDGVHPRSYQSVARSLR